MQSVNLFSQTLTDFFLEATVSVASGNSRHDEDQLISCYACHKSLKSLHLAHLVFKVHFPWGQSEQHLVNSTIRVHKTGMRGTFNRKIRFLHFLRKWSLSPDQYLQYTHQPKCVSRRNKYQTLVWSTWLPTVSIVPRTWLNLLKPSCWSATGAATSPTRCSAPSGSRCPMLGNSEGESRASSKRTSRASTPSQNLKYRHFALKSDTHLSQTGSFLFKTFFHDLSQTLKIFWKFGEKTVKSLWKRQKWRFSVTFWVEFLKRSFSQLSQTPT